MTEYVPAEGDVEIELDGVRMWLKPTLNACLIISRVNGTAGPRVLADQCLQLNLDAISTVIAAGLGVRVEDIQGQVFKTGTMNLFGKCIRFIHVVSNGGRLPVSGDEETLENPQKIG